MFVKTIFFFEFTSCIFGDIWFPHIQVARINFLEKIDEFIRVGKWRVRLRPKQCERLLFMFWRWKRQNPPKLRCLCIGIYTSPQPRIQWNFSPVFNSMRLNHSWESNSSPAGQEIWSRYNVWNRKVYYCSHGWPVSPVNLVYTSHTIFLEDLFQSHTPFCILVSLQIFHYEFVCISYIFHDQCMSRPSPPLDFTILITFEYCDKLRNFSLWIFARLLLRPNIELSILSENILNPNCSFILRD
jgi:hypothetical protein